MSKIVFTIDNVHTSTVQCFENAIAKKYIKILHQHVNKGMHIDNIESFGKYRSDKQTQDMLLESIDNINIFFKRKVIDLKVDWNNHDFYNNLHEVFENLNGEWDKPTRLIKMAPKKIKESIRNLNRLLHELEPGTTRANQYHLRWDKDHIWRENLSEKEYATITYERTAGHVYVGYNEVGKTHQELYQDHLPADYENTKNWHHIGPDLWFERESGPWFKDGFVDWCKDSGIDPYDSKTGLGGLPIGTWTQTFNDTDLSYQSKFTDIQIYD